MRLLVSLNCYHNKSHLTLITYMQFILLTHAREFVKKSATGPIVKQVLAHQCSILEWSRTAPDNMLTKGIEQNKTLLIYPEAKGSIRFDIETQDLSTFDTFVILDGTWQEARKIYNRSPYLHPLTHYALEVDYCSRYSLRRNQKNTGLCTAEVVIELLKQRHHYEQAVKLEAAFTRFNLGLSQTEINND